VLTGAAIGHEPGHLQSDAPYLGEGLAGAVGRLLAEAPPAAPIACTYASFNGERYWAREFGVARVRNSGHFADAMQMEHPAECCGDLGAAHGPLLACLAAHAWPAAIGPGPAWSMLHPTGATAPPPCSKRHADGDCHAVHGP
jgi:3-oxoacyl-[acyl-carrier-protein] synthase-1